VESGVAEAKPLQTRVKSVLEDPSVAAIARVYAEGFLNALPAAQVDSTLEEFHSFVHDVLPSNPDFDRILAASMVGRDKKLALIDNVLKGRASELFVGFLSVLARHDRLDLMRNILHESQRLYEKRSGKRRVQVTSAQPLSEQVLARVQQRLAQTLPFIPIVEAAVDASLLGGLRIRVGDTVYDGSLRARLKQLRHRVHERSLHEIQSGRDRFSHSERD
jgi:F-type H+-transporting ATPase subunit delta